MFTKQCSVDYVNVSAQLQRNKCKDYYVFEIFKDISSFFKSRPLLVLNQRHRGKCQGVQSQRFSFLQQSEGRMECWHSLLVFLVVDKGGAGRLYCLFEITSLQFKV